VKLDIKNWNIPKEWLKIKTIDVHVEGEPLRIILEGLPNIPGKTILEKRNYFLKNLDHFRKALIWEPRGHADMYGAVITEPENEESDFGVLFLHNEGLSTMCGHGIIGLVTAVLETDMLPKKTPFTEIKIDTPAGLIKAFGRIENNRVKSVKFQNVPSFVYALDKISEVPGVGKVKYDIAFGGAFYAFVQAKEIGIELIPKNYRKLIDIGMKIKRTVMEVNPPIHPFEKDLSYLYGTIFIGPPQHKNNHSRNVCIFAEGEVDRSPTGTGLSARLAIHFKRGEIKIDESMKVESIIGTKFKGKIVKKMKYGPYEAIIPEIEGSAYIIGKNEIIINPEDPLKEGFFLR